MNDALNLAIRSTFEGTAGAKLKLVSTGATEETNGTVLHFTGFHADGAPFVVRCAPFTGSPLERAAQLAADIIQTHTGVPFMPAPVAIRSLAATLRDSLASASARATAMAASAVTEVGNLHSVLDEGDAMLKDVKAAAAEVQSALGLSTNGGPPLA